LRTHVKTHVGAIGVVLDVIVADTVAKNHTSANMFIHWIQECTQFSIKFWFKIWFTLNGAADHRDNDELASCLSAYRHGCVDGDADCEGGLEGGESRRHDGVCVTKDVRWKVGDMRLDGTDGNYTQRLR
jgi:hypothetical protein